MIESNPEAVIPTLLAVFAGLILVALALLRWLPRTQDAGAIMNAAMHGGDHGLPESAQPCDTSYEDPVGNDV